MNQLSSCMDKVGVFRVKELKEVLTYMGLSKQGRKQDLVDRIHGVLSDVQAFAAWAEKNALGEEDVVKLISDIYKKMQVSGSASRALVPSSSGNEGNTGVDELPNVDNIRCLCGSILPTDPMIKCEDPRCHMWQHSGCVLIPEKPMEGVSPSPPEVFYCENCRLSRADPFCVTVAQPLYPVKLITTSLSVDGSNPLQSVERSFQLTRADKDLLLLPEYDVQAWCMLLNDKVYFRMQWPQNADLQVNGTQVCAVNRPVSQLLGANGRDDGPIITQFTRDGSNKITLSGCDSRVFCLGVRIIKRRTIQQILNLIPKEVEGEKLEDALARVRRCVGGETAAENGDGDNELEIIAGCSSTVSLRCPMSGSRMKVAGRFKPCVHLGCFDLHVYVEMNQRSRKWQCPHCLKNYSLENIIIDPYFNRITSKMRDCEEEVTEVEIKPDGSWRAKVTTDESRSPGDHSFWHYPDGTLSAAQGSTMQTQPEAHSSSSRLRGHHKSNGVGTSNGKTPAESDVKFEDGVVSGSSGVVADVIILSDSDDEDGARGTAAVCPPPSGSSGRAVSTFRLFGRDQVIPAATYNSGVGTVEESTPVGPERISEDWFSLRVGGGGLPLQQQSNSNGDEMESVVAMPSFLIPRKGSGSSRSRKRPESPSQEQRSVKPRQYLPVDSDSD